MDMATVGYETYGQTFIFVWHQCGECGVPFGMPKRFLDARHDDGENFYCPNGHPRVFRTSTEDRLRTQLEHVREERDSWKDDARRERSNAQHHSRRAAALKGVVTRTKRRIANGSCPCCKRHFKNLERHISSKHPDYADLV